MLTFDDVMSYTPYLVPLGAAAIFLTPKIRLGLAHMKLKHLERLVKDTQAATDLIVRKGLEGNKAYRTLLTQVSKPRGWKEPVTLAAVTTPVSYLATNSYWDKKFRNMQKYYNGIITDLL